MFAGLAETLEDERPLEAAGRSKSSIAGVLDAERERVQAIRSFVTSGEGTRPPSETDEVRRIAELDRALSCAGRPRSDSGRQLLRRLDRLNEALNELQTNLTSLPYRSDVLLEGELQIGTDDPTAYLILASRALAALDELSPLEPRLIPLAVWRRMHPIH